MIRFTKNLKSVASITAKENARFCLTDVAFQKEGSDGFRLYATDGRKMFLVRERPKKGTRLGKVLCFSKSLVTWALSSLRAGKKPETFTVSTNNDGLLLEGDGRSAQLQARKESPAPGEPRSADGVKFPDPAQVFREGSAPGDKGSYTFTVNADLMIQVLKAFVEAGGDRHEGAQVHIVVPPPNDGTFGDAHPKGLVTSAVCLYAKTSTRDLCGAVMPMITDAPNALGLWRPEVTKKDAKKAKKKTAKRSKKS